MTIILSFVTVYKHTKDFPDQYVARYHHLTDKGETFAGELVGVSPIYSNLLQIIEPLGLVRTMRHPADDPCILETWI